MKYLCLIKSVNLLFNFLSIIIILEGKMVCVLRINYFIPKESKYYTESTVSSTENIRIAFAFYQINKQVQLVVSPTLNFVAHK